MYNFIQMKTTADEDILINAEQVVSASETENGVNLRMLDNSTIEVKAESLEAFEALTRNSDSRSIVLWLIKLHELFRNRLH